MKRWNLISLLKRFYRALWANKWRLGHKMRFLIFLIYLASEIFLIAEFIDEWGFLAFVGEVVLSAFLGFGILASQFGAVGADLRGIMSFRVNLGAFLGRSIFRTIGGILLILPFIISDILGACFVVLSLFFKANARDFGGDSKFGFGDSTFYFRGNYKFDSKGDFDSKRDSNNSDIIDAEIIEHIDDKKQV